VLLLERLLLLVLPDHGRQARQQACNAGQLHQPLRLLLGVVCCAVKLSSCQLQLHPAGC
jgi:hypothetical protein